MIPQLPAHGLVTILTELSQLTRIQSFIINLLAKQPYGQLQKRVSEMLTDTSNNNIQRKIQINRQ